MRRTSAFLTSIGGAALAPALGEYRVHRLDDGAAHTVGSKAEAAYRRGDLFDKRGK